MKENKSKFPKSLSEIKLFPCPPAADDFCKQVSHKSDDMWSYRSKATQSLWLSSCCSSHGCRSHLSSFIQAARCRSEKQSLCLQLHHVASIFDSDCFICHCQRNPPKQKTNPSARLGNEGHINMCCANSCTGRGEATLQGGGVAPPFTLHCHKIRGCFKMEIQDATWSSWLWRQSGESTVDDVTTRQTRQKVARNMFLPGAYKLLPGFSSPRPSAVMLPSNSQTAQTTLQHTHNMYYKTFALRHANTHWCTHLSASVAPIVQKKMCTDPTEDFHALSLWSTHTYTHIHNLITSVEAGVGVLEIKAGQGVIWYLRLLHAHALDSHQRHVPHFSSALASSGWYHTTDIAAFSPFLALRAYVCVFFKRRKHENYTERCLYTHLYVCVRVSVWDRWENG